MPAIGKTFHTTDDNEGGLSGAFAHSVASEVRGPRFAFLLVLAVLVYVLSSCSTTTQAATPIPRDTSAVAAATPTREATEKPTDVPLQTPEPTHTSTPTLTPSPTLQPTATSEPTMRPTETATLIDMDCVEASFVSDVTIPDGTHLEYGQAFTKTWRIRNTGACAWPEDSMLVFAEGDGLSDQAPVSVGAVAPGDDVDISVPMDAPSEMGEWSEHWELQVKGRAFSGGRLSASVHTGEPPTPTLSGQVLWWTTPLPAVRVELREQPLSPVIAEAVTDENGHFVIENPPTGQVAIWAYVPEEGFMPHMERQDIRPGTDTVTIYVPKPVLSGMSVSDAPGMAPTLTWPSFPDATEYCVWLRPNRTPFVQMIQECVAEPSWTVGQELQAGQEYCWHLQAKVNGVPIATYVLNCFTKQ